jgi:hypothetical protein
MIVLVGVLVLAGAAVAVVVLTAGLSRWAELTAGLVVVAVAGAGLLGAVLAVVALGIAGIEAGDRSRIVVGDVGYDPVRLAAGLGVGAVLLAVAAWLVRSTDWTPGSAPPGPADGARTDEHPLRQLWRYAGRHRPTIVLASAFSVLNKAMDLAPPFLIGMAVDIVVQREASMIGTLFGIDSLRTQLLVLAAINVVVWVLESLFEYAYGVTWRNLAQTIQHEARLDAYGHVQDLELAYFEDRSTGGLMAVLNDDVNQLERFLDRGANDILQVLTTVVLVGGAFFVLVPTIAPLAFAPIPFILWGSFRFQRRLEPRYATVRDKVGLLNSSLANNLGGIATIKAFTAEDREVARIGAESTTTATPTVRRSGCPARSCR